VFQPPFDGLWFAVLLYFVAGCLINPHNPVLRGHLSDPDDYMYLDQVIDWLKGQGWYDNIQHRLNPPTGMPIHFSRLTEMPMAALLWLFRLFGLPLKQAAFAMALVEPVFLLAGFLVSLRWIAENLMPKEWAAVTAYIALFPMGLLTQFVPGHIDHHGLVVGLVGLALGCAARMMKTPEDIRWGIGAGFVLALTLTVALASLPYLILISAWLGLWAIVRGQAAARSGLAFGLSLFVSSLVFLAVTEPPAALLAPNLVAYSIVYVSLAGGIGIVFAGIALAARSPMPIRWVTGILLAAATGTAFLFHFPALLTGPIGAVDPLFQHLIFDNVVEAKPLTELKGDWFLTVVAVLGPLYALGAAGFYLWRKRPEERWHWGLLTLLLAAALLLTVFYQCRFIGELGLFTVLPLAALLRDGWIWAGAHRSGRRKAFLQISLLLLIGPVPMIALPMLIDGRPLGGDVAAACHADGLEAALDASAPGGKSSTIMNTVEIGPELLFRTSAMAIAAPFHQEVSGNLDAVRFFSATDMDQAEAIIRRRQVDLIFACTTDPQLYADLAPTQDALPAGKNNQAPEKPYPLILRLIAKQRVPGWLLPFPLPAGHNGYVAYEVVP
jgi:hypothetical protein